MDKVSTLGKMVGVTKGSMNVTVNTEWARILGVMGDSILACGKMEGSTVRVATLPVPVKGNEWACG